MYIACNRYVCEKSIETHARGRCCCCFFFNSRLSEGSNRLAVTNRRLGVTDLTVSHHTAVTAAPVYNAICVIHNIITIYKYASHIIHSSYILYYYNIILYIYIPCCGGGDDDGHGATSCLHTSAYIIICRYW